MKQIKFLFFAMLLSMAPLFASEDGSEEDFFSARGGSSRTSSPDSRADVLQNDSRQGSHTPTADEGAESDTTVVDDDERASEGEVGGTVVPVILEPGSGEAAAAAPAAEQEQEDQGSRIERWVLGQSVRNHLGRLQENIFTRLWRRRIQSALGQHLHFRALEDFMGNFRQGVAEQDLETIKNILIEEGVARGLLKETAPPFNEYRNARKQKVYLEGIDGLEVSPEAIAFSHDGKTVVFARQRTLFFFSTETGRCIQKLEPAIRNDRSFFNHGPMPADVSISALCFSPDDNRICLAVGKKIFVFSVAKNQQDVCSLALEEGTAVCANPVAVENLYIRLAFNDDEHLAIYRLNAQKIPQRDTTFIVKAHVKGTVPTEEAHRRRFQLFDDDVALAPLNNIVNVDQVWSFECGPFLNAGDFAPVILRQHEENYSLLEPGNQNRNRFVRDFYTVDGQIGWPLFEGVPACLCIQQRDVGPVVSECRLSAVLEDNQQLFVSAPYGNRVLARDEGKFYVYEVANNKEVALALYAHKFISEIFSGGRNILQSIEIALSLLFILNKAQGETVDIVAYSLNTIRLGEDFPSIVDTFPFEIKEMLSKNNRYRVVRERPHEKFKELFFAGRWLNKKVIFTLISFVLFLKRYHIWNKPGIMKLLHDVMRVITLGRYKPVTGRLL